MLTSARIPKSEKYVNFGGHSHRSHEVTGFLSWIGTYCISCVVQQRSRVKDLSFLAGYDDS